MEVQQNRIQAFAFVISICIAFCLACICASGFDRSLRVINNSEIHLDNRINPNLAPLESLVRLPNIGISKAEAIISYRENFLESNNKKRAFENSDDLQEVNGIGPKTVQNISQWLEFE